MKQITFFVVFLFILCITSIPSNGHEFEAGPFGTNGFDSVEKYKKYNIKLESSSYVGDNKIELYTCTDLRQDIPYVERYSLMFINDKLTAFIVHIGNITSEIEFRDKVVPALNYLIERYGNYKEENAENIRINRWRHNKQLSSEGYAVATMETSIGSDGLMAYIAFSSLDMAEFFKN